MHGWLQKLSSPPCFLKEVIFGGKISAEDHVQWNCVEGFDRIYFGGLLGYCLNIWLVQLF